MFCTMWEGPWPGTTYDTQVLQKLPDYKQLGPKPIHIEELILFTKHTDDIAAVKQSIFEFNTI